MESIGRLLIGVGLGIAAVGVVVVMAEKIPGFRLGRLPGDIAIQKDGFSLYVPITTMLLISGFGSLVLWLLGRWRR